MTDGTAALIKLGATSLGLIAGFSVMVVRAARSRLRPSTARVFRGALAAVGAVITSGVGYVFFFFGVHRSTPIQRLMAWVGVPFLQYAVEFDRFNSELGTYAALLAGYVTWVLVFYALFSLMRIPHIVRSSRAMHVR